MGDPPCYREFCPTCERVVVCEDGLCPDCGSELADASTQSGA